MDALSDISEDYVRQMLDETEAPGASAKVGGSVSNIPIIMNSDTGFRSDRKHTAGAGKPFGGKLRYLALAACAAACFAGVAGIMHLHQGGSEESLVADSVMNELEIENKPAATTVSEAAEAVTAAAPVTSAKQTTTAASAASVSTGTLPPETTAAAAPESPASSAAAPEAPASSAAASAVVPVISGTTSAARSTTTFTTTATTESYTVTTTIPRHDDDPDLPTVESNVPYTQTYLLGDVDADGDVTLFDYFLARQAENEYIRTGRKIIDDAAADRACMYRNVINNDLFDSMNENIIRDLAVYRAFLGRPDLTADELDRLWFEFPSAEIGNNGLSTAQQALGSLYEATELDGGFLWFTGDAITGEMVPEPIRDFYNAAHAFSPESGFACDNWTEEEFRQKMTELRALFAQT